MDVIKEEIVSMNEAKRIMNEHAGGNGSYEVKVNLPKEPPHAKKTSK